MGKGYGRERKARLYGSSDGQCTWRIASRLPTQQTCPLSELRTTKPYIRFPRPLYKPTGRVRWQKFRGGFHPEAIPVSPSEHPLSEALSPVTISRTSGWRIRQKRTDCTARPTTALSCSPYRCAVGRGELTVIISEFLRI